MKRNLKIEILAGLMILLTVGAAIAITRVKQTFPPVLVSAGMTINCPTLMTTGKPQSGVMSNITFNCVANTPAFTVTGESLFTPSFNLTSKGYGHLYVENLSSVGVVSGAFQIQDGTAYPILLGNYNYIGTYDGLPRTSLPSFNITWAFA